MNQFMGIISRIFMLSLAGGNVGYELGNTWIGLWGALFVLAAMLVWADLYDSILERKYS